MISSWVVKRVMFQGGCADDEALSRSELKHTTARMHARTHICTLPYPLFQFTHSLNYWQFSVFHTHTHTHTHTDNETNERDMTPLDTLSQPVPPSPSHSHADDAHRERDVGQRLVERCNLITRDCDLEGCTSDGQRVRRTAVAAGKGKKVDE